MKTLYKSVLLIDPQSPLHGKRRDIITDGQKIVEIGTSLSLSKGKVVDAKQLVLSHGWIDSYAHFRDPGEEAFENFESGTAAALAGGFKHVALSPATNPVVDHKTGIERIVRAHPGSGVTFIPLGTLSAGMEGAQLSEQFDMHLAGARGFTDDKGHVSSGLMLRALEYVKSFDGLVISFPYDHDLSPQGQTHEGPVSVGMGVKGIPEIAEELRLQRDIELLRYSLSKLHINMISTARSVDMIRKAKKEGLRITCGIAAHQLSYLDQDCAEYDSRFKVLPPFRNKAHQKALIQGIKDGTIDVVCSDHRPWDTEHKDLEFEYASEGVSGIQTTFQQIYQALSEHLEIADILRLITVHPARIFGIPLPEIQSGVEVAHTIVSLAEYSEFSGSAWKSKSVYHPLHGQRLKGKIYS
jgi:dihydroorotase